MSFTRRGKTPDGRPSYRWVVEFEVSETWVEDGFDLDSDEKALDMLAHRLGWARQDMELKARVLKRPDPSLVAVAQGYPPEKETA